MVKQVENKLERLVREIEQLDKTCASWMAQGRAVKDAARQMIINEGLAARLDMNHEEVLELAVDAGRPFFEQADKLQSKRVELVDQVKAEIKWRATVRVTETKATA